MRPLTDKTTGLAIAWEPGDPWEPVQRWFVYELFPKVATPHEVLRQLEGPHPRSTGHGCFGTNELGTWCTCTRFTPWGPIADPKYRWVGGPAPGITRQAWLLYREYHAWARPCFVIQGSNGGHKYRYTSWESRLSMAAGGRKQPHAAGDLPYAEPDSRTWESLKLFADPDLMKKYRALVGFGMRRPFDLDATDRRAAEFAATEILKSFGNSVIEHADELAWSLKQTDSRSDFNAPREMPRGYRKQTPDQESAAVQDDLASDLAHT